MKLFHLALLLTWLVVAASGVAADEHQDAGDKRSGNYDKAEDLLPGEEVVTPTGQKLRVWSTRGPVEVSPPPQPFDDPEKAKVDDAHIVVDREDVLRD